MNKNEEESVRRKKRKGKEKKRDKNTMQFSMSVSHLIVLLFR